MPGVRSPAITASLTMFGVHKYNILAGIPLLLLISLFDLYSQISERAHRTQVLTNGVEAHARIQRASGIESVIVEWRDLTGALRTGQSHTGKPFARLARSQQDVVIKYDPHFVLEPVILSEAAERERVNNWWITSDLGVTSVIMLVAGMFGLFKFLANRSSR